MARPQREPSPTVRINDIVEQVEAYIPGADTDLIRRAYVFSAQVHQGQRRQSGVPYLTHPLEVARLVTQLRLNETAVAAALLHDVLEDTLTGYDDLQNEFGEEVAELVEGVTKLGKLQFDSARKAQAENFRKMLMAMSHDLRVILLKLCDRMHNMRTLEFLPVEKQRKIAQETADIYAPLAERLGIYWMKGELEDLCFKALKPDLYTNLAKQLEKYKRSRKQYISEVRGAIEDIIAEAGVSAEVHGRMKHVASIYKKMEEQNLSLEQVYDILAFRVIVNTLRECYEVLGLLHATWTPVPGRFKDYVAMPKPNMYQSLHTTVVGPEGEPVEIQIRTREMHRIAEEGVAAHWKYKDGGRIDVEEDKTFAWLRQLLEWQQDLRDPGEFLETIRLDLFPEEVYVFTPKGEVRHFPQGATPVDFAYSIHSDVGKTCAGARVNGQIVPLDYTLQNGDRVEILTDKRHLAPSKDWLNFVVTPRARAKIRSSLNAAERDRSISIGQDILERDLKKSHHTLTGAIRSGRIKEIAESLGFRDEDSLFAAVGFGKIGKDKILNELVPPDEQGEASDEPALTKLFREVGKTRKAPIKVRGIDDVLIRLARCCDPLPGDDLLGFVTRGRGVTVHRASCPHALATEPDRRVDVEWDEEGTFPLPVGIRVVCIDKPGLLASISKAITAAKANISKADIRTTRDAKAVCSFEVAVQDVNQLEDVLASLQKAKGVISVERSKGAF